jgi:hypothetical protein
MNTASDALATLIGRLSVANLPSVMHLTLNAEMPARLRSDVWKLHLNHPRVREQATSSRWIDMVSRHDIKITHMLDMIVKESPYGAVLDGSRGAREVTTLRGILSFHTLRSGDDAPPDQSMCWLGLPLLVAFRSAELFLSPRSSNTSVGANLLSPETLDLLERYTALVDLQVDVVKLNKDLAQLEGSKVLGEVSRLLEKHSPDLLDHVRGAMGGAPAAQALKELCRVSVMCALVDVLSPEAGGFVFDQGLVLGFHAVLPRLLFCLLYAVRRPLMDCNGDVEQLKAILRER